MLSGPLLATQGSLFVLLQKRSCQGGFRSHRPLLFRQVLYQMSYLAIDQCREQELHLRPLSYEPSELLLLHPGPRLPR